MKKINAEKVIEKIRIFPSWLSFKSYSSPFIYIPLRNYAPSISQDTDARNSRSNSPKFDENHTEIIETACERSWKFTIVFAFVLLLFSLFYYSSQHLFLLSKEYEEFYHGAEEEFSRIPSAEKAKEWLRFYSSKPHLAGSFSDYEQAKWTRDKFIEFGIPVADIQTYYPLLNYPGQRRVSIVEPASKRFDCSLTEKAIDEDETSGKYRDAVPPFHGYSANGNVTGKLVYVNYGRREDFEVLMEKGVDFKNTIALVRYGKNFRGLKVRAAEDFGCAGIIIYSDPFDDGFNKGEVYPGGPWRPETSVQRGSVHYMSLYPGDPLTPGYAAHKGSRRLPIKKATALPKIPSLPLSYADAKPLLQALLNSGFPASDLAEDWKGGLDIEYWTGPGDTVVNLLNNNTYKISPVWNVMGQIPGADEPEKAIVIGNHRDAWVFGAADPSSGSSCMLEVARAYGELLKNGWRPRRTIILASWDAEEYGMVGSVEYVEDKVKLLSESVVAYLNVDTGASGPYFVVQATPSLSQMIRNITRLIVDPRTGKTLYETWKNSENGLLPDEDNLHSEVSSRTLPLVGTLGSGSDFVGFVDFVGAAAINYAFKGNYGVYHSNYDSFHWMEKFGDSNFKYHLTMSVLWGVSALRLADSVILPFNYTEYAVELRYYVSKIEEHAQKKFSHYQFLTMRSTIDDLEKVSTRLQQKILGIDIEAADETTFKQINDRLCKAEREFLDPKGIPSRPWYKHVVYAPGLWAGYGAATFPTLTESLDDPLIDIETLQRIENELAYRIKRVAIVLNGMIPSEIEKEHDILTFPL